MFPRRFAKYEFNRERSSGNWLLITISFHVSPPVKIEELIGVIRDPLLGVISEEGAGPTLPEPLSSGDFVERLEKALTEKPGGKNDYINLFRFEEVVLATARTPSGGGGGSDSPSVAPLDIPAVEAWASAVWVR